MLEVETGKQLKSGGIWVIGQDQDSLGGVSRPKIPSKVS
jgi:hypothetical protein